MMYLLLISLKPETVFIIDKYYIRQDIFVGIPDSPALANTYYSQFEEDFTPSDDDEEDESAETVIPKKPGGATGSDDDDDILFGSQDGTLTKKDDEYELFNQLQYVLDKDNDSGMYIISRPEVRLWNPGTGSKECQSIIYE